MSQADYAVRGFRQMAAGDLQGGTITYAGKQYAATITTFELTPLLTPGGYSQSLLGQAVVARMDLPATLEFKRDQPLTANPKAGPSRPCKIHSIKDLGALIELTLADMNQGA